MILVDTSVWIDHLHAKQPDLVELLDRDEVGCHPYVIEELALGSIRRRSEVLGLLTELHAFSVLSHTELLQLVQARALSGRGLSMVDAHLLGSALLTPGAQLWTRDKRLGSACRAAGVAFSSQPD